jgi:hypothetical protein
MSALIILFSTIKLLSACKSARVRCAGSRIAYLVANSDRIVC